MTQSYNFSAGPAMLPREVLLKIQSELLEYQNSKASVMEISHRGVDFMEAAEKSEQDFRELLSIPENYKVLFLQGGASAQFSMVPINLLRGGFKASYANTGHWSVKAIAEAQRYCEVNVCTDSTENNFTNIEDFQNWDIDEDASYLHYTPNETIAGLEFDYIPEVSMPIAADMSSTILSRPIDVSKFGVIYAGAQKNMGPAGTVMYAIDKEALGKTGRNIPSYLDLGVHLSKDSMFNTPPVFSIYTTLLTLRWLKNLGGIDVIEARNNAKAELIYEEIDRNELFTGYAETNSRSTMNATFQLLDDNHKEKFNTAWTEAGVSGINGHRSIGGYRASIYNALPLESVKVLVDVMKEFERTI